jgi:hypothetical protein
MEVGRELQSTTGRPLAGNEGRKREKEFPEEGDYPQGET